MNQVEIHELSDQSARFTIPPVTSTARRPPPESGHPMDVGIYGLCDVPDRFVVEWSIPEI